MDVLLVVNMSTDERCSGHQKHYAMYSLKLLSWMYGMRRQDTGQMHTCGAALTLFDFANVDCSPSPPPLACERLVLALCDTGSSSDGTGCSSAAVEG